MKINLNDQRRWQWLGFAVIAFFVLIVYAPSVLHGPRADQIAYFAEMASKTTWWDLAIDSYDLNRHRLFSPGDELLFRPIVYFILGTEKFLFGYHFLLWQAFGIAMHLLVVWHLLRLLLVIHQGPVAIFTAGFFALLFTNMEMVIWHHINSYLVFVVLMLVMLRWIYLFLQGQRFTNSQKRLFCVLLIAASFTYECAVVFSIVLFVVLFKKLHKHGLLWVVGIPPAIYVSLSVWNWFSQMPVSPEAGHIAYSLDLGKTFSNWVMTVTFWFASGLFPTQLDMMYTARNIISPFQQGLIKPLSYSEPAIWAVFGLIGVYLWALWQSFKSSGGRRSFAILVFFLASIYAAIIVVGRGNSRGMWEVLRIDLYYNYIFWVLAVLGAYALIDFKKVQNRIVGIASCAFLASLMIFNGHMTYVANDFQARFNNPVIILVKTIELLVKEHGHKPGFSFYVDPAYPGNYIYPELTKVGDPPERRYTFIEALYPQYFTTNRPKYQFLAKDKL